MGARESVWPYRVSDQAEIDDIFYGCVGSTGMPEFIKIIPVTHGPIRKRGKGKVNRDWENK